MRRRLFLLSVLVLTSLGASLWTPGLQAGQLVQLSPIQESAAALSIASARDLPAGWRYLPALDFYIVEENGQDRLDELRAQGAVEESEEDAEIQLEALPNDPMADAEGWITGLHVDIGAEEAWDFGTGSGEIIVAIIDTGISTDHPDLAPNLWRNPGEIAGNGKDDDKNGYTDDVHGFDFWGENGDVNDDNNHGSHLAGIIGAAGNDGLGVTGVNWRVSLMGLKFTDAKGNGTSSLAVEAIDYAIRHGARVINASWTLKLDGAAGSGWEASNLLRRAIDKAAEAGILFVTAAGNQFKTYEGLNIDDEPVYPASFDTENMLTVAALNSEGSLAAYSNYGPFMVDIAAPGSGIYSTGAYGQYASMSGTSIATAFVTGAAALILAERPDLDWPELKSILEESAEGEVSLNGRIATEGYLHLGNAIALAGGVVTPVPSASAPVSSPTTANPPPTRAISAPASGCNLNK